MSVIRGVCRIVYMLRIFCLSPEMFEIVGRASTPRARGMVMVMAIIVKAKVEVNSVMA